MIALIAFFLLMLVPVEQAFAQAVGIIGKDTPVNYVPIADPQDVTTTANTPITINLSGEDANGDTLTFNIVTPPSHGSLSGFDTATGIVIYTPNAGFSGSDNFIFKVNDGIVDSKPATVMIAVGIFTCVSIDSAFPGASSTHAYGINNAGDIVGIVDDATGRHGYKRSGGVVTAIRYPGGFTTYTNGINDLGQIVGFVQNPGNHGFVTSDGVTFIPINDPNAQEPNGTIPLAINTRSQIVGDFVSVSGSSFSHGFLTNDGVTFTTIDAPNASSTSANGINDAGEIVGHFADATGRLHGFLRSVNGTFTPFDFPEAGVIHTVANDINKMGQIVGYFVDAAGRLNGFLKDGTTLTAFDCQGATGTQIFGINDAGQIVGDYFDATMRAHGFVAKQILPLGDLDGDGDVDQDDLNILLRDRNKSVSQSACGARCDLNGDGVIDALDARILVTLCTRPRCATH